MELSKKKDLANRLLPVALNVLEASCLLWDIASEYELVIDRELSDLLNGKLISGISDYADQVRALCLETLEAESD